MKEEEEEWYPHEAHAVYECVQSEGPQVGTEAIVKVHVEVSESVPPSDDPQERAKEASGMRLNYTTEQEIENLQMLTAAGCSATPSLLGFKIAEQDESILNSKGKPGFEAKWGDDIKWWMPGGYIVYILMAKLDAQPLETYTFWKRFTRQERDEVRAWFQESYIYVVLYHGAFAILKSR